MKTHLFGIVGKGNRYARLNQGRASGFTLVELMVVIVIVATLAGFIFVLAQKGKSAASKATCISGLRQSAGVLLTDAQKNSGRLTLSKGGSGNFEIRPYFVISNQLGLFDDEVRTEVMDPLMSCPSAITEGNAHWDCFGVNFVDDEAHGVKWVTAPVKDSAGRQTMSYSLRLGSVKRQASHILIADSCSAGGGEIFRIHGNDLIGLRHDGSANAAFLDGSVRNLNKAALGAIGVEKVYDASVSPPELVTLKTDR